MDSLAARLLRDAGSTVIILHAPPGFGKRELADVLANGGAGSPIVDDNPRESVALFVARCIELISSVGSAIVVTTRPRVASQLFLRLKQPCTIVTSDDLRLDRPALAALLGCTVTDPVVRDLYLLTAGHPHCSRIIAVDRRPPWRMLGLAPQAIDDVASYFESFCGSLYEEEELARLKPLAGRTMIRSADNVDDSVLALLGEFAERGAFVSPMHGSESAFQIEPLFAHFIALRTANWDTRLIHDTVANFLINGEILTAFETALRLRDVEFASNVIAEAGGLKLLFRAGALAMPLLDRLPSNPTELGKAIGAKIFAALNTGRYAVATALLEAHDRLSDVPQDSLELLLIRWIVALNQGTPPPIETIEAGRSRYLLELLSDSVLHATLLQLAGASHCAAGRYQAAKDQLAAALSLIRSEDCPLLEHHCLLYSAIALARAGYVQRAEAEARQAWQGLAVSLGAESTQTAYAALVLARLLQEQGRYEEADLIVPSALWSIDSLVNWSDGSEFAIEAAASWIARTRGTEDALSFLHDRRAAAAGGQSTRGSSLRIAAIHFRQAELAGMQASVLRAVLHGFEDPGVNTDLDGDGLRLSICYRRLSIIEHPDSEGLHFELDRLRAVAIANGDMLCLFDVLKAMVDLDRLCGLESWRQRDADLVTHAESCGFVDRLAGISEDAAGDPDTTGCAGLTKREQQVLACIGNGMSSKEIALSLDIAFGTVKGYRREIYRKLGISRRSQAVAAARGLNS